MRGLSRAASIDLAVIVLVAFGMSALYALAYRAHPYHPHLGADPGWWRWFDQERYFTAATAWAGGDLDPQLHWYLPGYALLAAPFVRLLSVHAFFPVNLICLLISLWLFTRLAARLACAVPHAPAVGAALFATTTVLSPLGLDIWVVPWSTSGAVPLFYACLLAATGFVSDPRRSGQAFLAGLSGCLIMAFRPSDMFPLLASCSLGMAAALLARRPGRAATLRGLAAGAAGAASAGLIMAMAYLPLYGLSRSPYVAASAMIGFDSGLIPLRWVTIMLSPQPLLSEGRGLIEAFPWMAAGMAGLGVFLLLPLRGAARTAHFTVIMAVVLHTAVYLAYRDLNPGGLFRFWNYHYFKWMYPVLALYALLLLHALLDQPRRRPAIVVIGTLTLAALLPWRAELRITGNIVPSRGGENQISFASDMTSVRDAVLIHGSGEWGSIYLAPSSLAVGGRSFGLGDIKPMPREEGFVLTPLRTLPAGPAVLTMDRGVHIDHTLPILAAHQDVIFGIPCWLPSIIRDCPERLFFPPPPLPADNIIHFDGSEAPFLTNGWSINEGTGRWTDGNKAEIRFQLPPNSGNYILTFSGYAYVPGGASPLKIRILSNDRIITDSVISQTSALSLSGKIGAASPIETLTLRFDNPRSPKDFDSTSNDGRRLGLFIQSITVSPAPNSTSPPPPAESGKSGLY